MTFPRWPVLRGVGAAVGLLVAIIGVPVVLLTLGGSLPHVPVTWHQVHQSLTRPITDRAILQGIALAGWVLWLLFAAAVGIEVTSLLRARGSRSTGPARLRVPVLQGLAGALVVAVVVLTPGRSQTAGAAPARAAAVASAPAPPVPASALAAVAAADAPPPGLGPQRYVVRRYDSPWLIAERHLGDGLRWREITDDTGQPLMDGEQIVETAHGRLVEATARTIFPGQILLLPSGGPRPPAAPDGRAAAPPPARPPAPPPAPAPAPAPAPITVWDGATAVEPAGTSPAGSAALAASRVRPIERPGPLPGQQTPPLIPAGELLLATALVASAALNVVSARRRRQAGQAAAGRRLPLPPPPVRRAEGGLRAARRDDLVRALDAAAGALALDLARTGQPAPPVTAFVAGDVVEAILTQPATPPPPWVASDDRLRWRLPIEDLPALAATGHPALFPALVPIGRIAQSEEHLLVNLEAAGMTGVRGDPERACDLVRSAAVALTGLPWTMSADVVLIGFGEVLAACQAHVRVAPSLRHLSTELRATADGVAAQLSSLGMPNVAAGRLAAGGAGLTATIVLCSHPPTSDEAALLRDVCREDTGITALVAGDIGAHRTLDLADGGLLVPDLGLAVEPASLDQAGTAAFADILQLALGPPVLTPDDPPYRYLEGPSHVAPRSPPAGHVPSQTHEPVRPAEPIAAPELVQPAVQINVVGAIDIEGLDVDFRRPHARETAVYLAMHPRGVAEHQLDEAVWPERHLVKATTRDPVVSSARRALGGPGRMPHAQGQGPDKRYQTTDEVGTDWHEFCVLAAHGRRTGTVESLQAALALVRGRPFADVVAGPGYAWLHLEGHLHHMEAEIVDTADLACQLLLDRRDPVGARWAANQGLRAGPYAERLWVQLMAVADALGEAQDVERILVEMDRRLDLESDYSQLHPDTLAAYRRYSRRNRRLA